MYCEDYQSAVCHLEPSAVEYEAATQIGNSGNPGLIELEDIQPSKDDRVSPPLAPSRDGANRDEDLPPLKNFQQGDFLYLDLRSGE